MRLFSKALEEPRIKLLGTILPDDCKIFIVDGMQVRNEFNIEFVLGGHHYVGPNYERIPEDEIWVEDTGDTQDVAADTAHEIVERILMKFTDMEYDDAHEVASSVEKVLRLEESGNEKKGLRYYQRR